VGAVRVGSVIVPAVSLAQTRTQALPKVTLLTVIGAGAAARANGVLALIPWPTASNYPRSQTQSETPRLDTVGTQQSARFLRCAARRLPRSGRPRSTISNSISITQP
jgi:hypothetical protein